MCKEQQGARCRALSETGTYSYRRGKLTITTKDGQKQEYTYRIDGTFVRELPWGELVVFSRSKD